MTKELAGESTAVLMDEARYGDHDHDLSYRAGQELLRRWRRGVDLEFLVGLMQSEKSSDRLRAAYCLGELGEAVEVLKIPATEFASDPLPDCRVAFVNYMSTSGYYDEAIAKALANCLLDLDLYVRTTAIKWAVRTTVDRLQELSRLVLSGTGRFELKFRNPLSNDFWEKAVRERGIRGIEIIRRLRAGEEIQHIRKGVSGEDSFVLDSILFSRTRGERSSKWEKMKSKDRSPSPDSC
ncbi:MULTISPECIES: hypothetical protein [unclassified Mesorhizobium]|uniref:hypothetical protein n=1 Tax=unclassified Mesorhizobium TaxID=325217 RepID=UPI00333DDDBB